MSRESYKLDNKLTAMMVEDMIFDPILAAKVLLRIKVPPHEELRILWMWSTYFTNDDSGFSTGKSFTFAIISALRSILFTHRISGLISKTFAQGKLIFQNFDRWYDTSPIFRSCIKHKQGKARLVHGNDVWIAEFTNGSMIRVLPPDFLKDSERVRSERWNDGYFDEWTVYGNFTAFNRTLIGRCTKENQFMECPVRQNHIHLASTPGFTYNPAYSIVRNINNQISQGNTDYGRFSCNYRHVPVTRKWKWLVDRKTIFHMQTTLPSGIVKSEIDGKWQKDSGAWYETHAIQNCRSASSPLLKRHRPEDIYFCAFDVARGGSSAGGHSRDDFALSVLRLTIDQAVQHVLTVRKSGVTAAQMSGIVHKYHQRFDFRFIGFDPGGGGLFVKDELLKEVQIIDGQQHMCLPICGIIDPVGIGYHILISMSRSDYYYKLVYGSANSDSVFVNRIHNDFKLALENQKVILLKAWDKWTEMGIDPWDADIKRNYLNKSTGLSEYDLAIAEMDLAVSQLMSVDIDRDAEKIPKVDSFGMFKFLSTQKKDSAYSLVYAYYLVKLHLDLLKKYSNQNSGNKGLAVFASQPL